MDSNNDERLHILFDIEYETNLGGDFLNKELYVMQNGKPERLIIRNYTAQDFDALIDVQRQSFPSPYPEELWWNKEQLLLHTTLFADGALCAEVNGVIVGSMTCLIVEQQEYEHQHEWSIITDDGYIRTHNAQGDTLYVADICVVPAYRKAGIGKWLVQSMYETVVQLGLKSLLGGSRMPGYYGHRHSLTPEQYVDQVIAGELNDPVISFLLRCGRVPVRVAHHYLDDEQSCNNAVIMEWRNPFLVNNERTI